LCLAGSGRPARLAAGSGLAAVLGVGNPSEGAIRRGVAAVGAPLTTFRSAQGSVPPGSMIGRTSMAVSTALGQRVAISTARSALSQSRTR
jgi:hypothetical protein